MIIMISGDRRTGTQTDTLIDACSDNSTWPGGWALSWVEAEEGEFCEVENVLVPALICT